MSARESERRLGPAALERLARAAREAATPAEALARYELGPELGRGAMGVVVQARDLELDRLVALKLLSRTAELSPGARARFLREARAAARLSHPFIAAVYDANEAFIAMQLVGGHDLARRPIRDPRLVATLVRDAALAVHYAHSQGIVHRDLKPANLMATSDDPPRVYVMDFGLAKETELDADLSRSGSIVGTPAYMAPEQALGTGGAVDARTDVYGLGATLYDQLAGRPPFLGESVLELLKQVVEDEVPPLRMQASHVDRDLSTIVHMCLAKDPERRYSSALALAGDLDRWLSGEMILARPPSLAYRARRFVAKRQGALAAALSAAMVVVLVLLPFWLQTRERRASAERALVFLERSERAMDRALELRASSRPVEAAEILEEATRAAAEFSAHADVGRASLTLGRLLVAQGRTEDAIAAFDRALELDSTLHEARFERGIARGVLVREGTPIGDAPSAEMEALREAAIADLTAEPVPDDPLPPMDTTWGQGCLAWLQGDYELAEHHCEDVLSLDPTHVQARLVLARIASEAGEADRAMFLTAEAVDVMGGMGQIYRDRAQGGSAAIEADWTRLPGRRELILDMRKAAATAPTMTFASGALAQEGLEAGARALAAGAAAAALRELDAAEVNLTRALRAADEDPAILAARGVCSLLRDEALSGLARTSESAEARAAAARDLTAAGGLDGGEVRAVACWNTSLLEQRKSLLALLAGDSAAAGLAREEAEAARALSLAAVSPGSELAALLRTDAEEPRDLSELILPVLDEGGLPALGAAIVTSAGLEAIGAVGLRAWEGSEDVTSDDQWHIGSCTKSMTATLAARLVDRGALTWDTTIGDVFAASMPRMDPAWKDVPITWLLCHRSGASLNLTKVLWDSMEQRGGTAREQRRFFVEAGLTIAPDEQPNTKTIYSNAAFMIAGAMLEELEDASWEDLMRREIFEPLGMTRTGFGAPGTPEQLDQPLGHTRASSGWSAIPLGPLADNPAAVGPAGTVHTSLADWARFLCAHLRGEQGDESYLKTETWKRLHSPPGDDWTYAPGWVVSEQEWAGGMLLSHLGSNTYWVCEASLALERDFAVLIVTNVGDDAAEEPFRRLLDALVADHLARAK